MALARGQAIAAGKRRFPHKARRPVRCLGSIAVARQLDRWGTDARGEPESRGHGRSAAESCTRLRQAMASIRSFSVTQGAAAPQPPAIHSRLWRDRDIELSI